MTKPFGISGFMHHFKKIIINNAETGMTEFSRPI